MKGGRKATFPSQGLVVGRSGCSPATVAIGENKDEERGVTAGLLFAAEVGRFASPEKMTGEERDRDGYGGAREIGEGSRCSPEIMECCFPARSWSLLVWCCSGEREKKEARGRGVRRKLWRLWRREKKKRNGEREVAAAAIEGEGEMDESLGVLG
ncbi:hypothetical protein HAX54_007853 [Datura stramonium]|uniref:Uncharacterized protein n=1 Tax=Datura stramonium TaxID=4076 RepID=A0ABS8RVM3_DATST|nr:hypothetical protein [Datura stramonium]